MGVMSIRQCYSDERLSVDWSDHRIIIAVASIIFNPTFWNIVARKGISILFFSLALDAMDIYSRGHGKRLGKGSDAWSIVGIVLTTLLATYTYLFNSDHLRIPIKVHHPHVQRKQPLWMLRSGCHHLYPRFGPRCCVRTRSLLEYNICKGNKLTPFADLELLSRL